MAAFEARNGMVRLPRCGRLTSRYTFDRFNPKPHGQQTGAKSFPRLQCTSELSLPLYKGTIKRYMNTVHSFIVALTILRHLVDQSRNGTA